MVYVATAELYLVVSVAVAAVVFKLVFVLVLFVVADIFSDFKTGDGDSVVA